MCDIFDEILDKMYDFGVKCYGKHPNWLYINHDHLYKIKASINFRRYVSVDLRSGALGKICGMQYVVRSEQKEIEVQ